MNVIAARAPVGKRPLLLRIESDPLKFHFCYAKSDRIWQ
jgi:hypothetical protein